MCTLIYRSILILFITHASSAHTLQVLNGNDIELSTLQGKWVFINYWASWCQPCIDEILELNKFYKYHRNDIALFAVNYENLSPAALNQLKLQFNINYPILKKDPATILGLGDIEAVPLTFVLNPQGKLSTTLYGAQTASSLKHAMQFTYSP